MKKVKSLKKRIRRLEARLQKGEKKLARLKEKLGTAQARAAAKPRKKPTTRSQKAKLAFKTDEKSGSPAKKSAVAKKAKRKLNLTPERREQLAAAMRARWAAKRAAAVPPNTEQSFEPQSGDTSHPQ
jgi:chromosome segregation ATPase